MSDMIERVARALTDHWENLEAKQQNYFRQKARTAIAAMREPTEAMCEAADAVECNQPECIWQGMIDAALEGQCPKI